ncbi:hypothetical protein [Methylacidimicrobium cyclopophantes]|uniref:hypothetical protein n=1 Tax=Methylacidimicrobium cyclopophantes TaxID=1041766 RepID=UPI00115BCBCA|nr:hypothetical protein [Methylacidimicrobium cyclopophantes]
MEEILPRIDGEKEAAFAWTKARIERPGIRALGDVDRLAPGRKWILSASALQLLAHLGAFVAQPQKVD